MEEESGGGRPRKRGKGRRKEKRERGKEGRMIRWRRHFASEE